MNNNDFVTQNLTLAAYLATIGFTFKGTTPRGEDILLFVFENEPNIMNAEALFLGGEASVNPVLYYENIKRLKSILYQYKQTGGNTEINRDAGASDEAKGN